MRESHVYIDPSGVVYDAMLGSSDTNRNSNKFHIIQIAASKRKRGKFWVATRWGRVGTKGTHKIYGPYDSKAAVKKFDTKFKHRTGHRWERRDAPRKRGKYQFLAHGYDSNAKGIAISESMLKAPVQQLMELIFNEKIMCRTLEALQYHRDVLPLDKLSDKMLEEGLAALEAVKRILDKGYTYTVAKADELADLSNTYFTYIPHNFGSNSLPVIDNTAMLEKELELLESLREMKIADEMVRKSQAATNGPHSLLLKFQGLGLKELEPLDPSSGTYKQLKQYLDGTNSGVHGITFAVEAIFRVDRGSQNVYHPALDKCGGSNRRLLWHGSHTTRFAGILSQGLRIGMTANGEARRLLPFATNPISGSMFGRGIYLADMSSKSARYCSRGAYGSSSLLLLCEAELGKDKYVSSKADSSAEMNAKALNAISTFGKGMMKPKKWMSAGVVGLPGVQMVMTRTRHSTLLTNRT
jgi:poly [ADP-ribose] polymerase